MKRCRHKWEQKIKIPFGSIMRYTKWDKCSKCGRIRITEGYSNGSIKRFYPGPEFKLREEK